MEPMAAGGLPAQIMRLTTGDDVVARGFTRRLVTLAPGEEQRYDGSAWADELVVVTCGRIELVGRCGRVIALERGDVLWLCDLPLAALRNPGPGETRLTAVGRGEADPASEG